jgi:hypothetical protein
MKIAILGSGHIGGGLGRAWRKKGHAVVFGARDPSDAELGALTKETGASVTTVADAPKGADVVVLAVPWGALDAVLAETGPLAGQLVIDCTNAVERGPGGMALKYGHTTSSSEELQRRIPKAKLFKSFNAQGAENLAAPVYGGVPASNFFCGDDAEARTVVKQLVEDVGFEAIDAGPLESARLLEPLMLLWIQVAMSGGSRDVAFKVLRR